VDRRQQEEEVMSCPERRCANCRSILDPDDEIVRGEDGLYCGLCGTDYLLSKDPERYNEPDDFGDFEIEEIEEDV
jgi:hypothetical protein